MGHVVARSWLPHEYKAKPLRTVVHKSGLLDAFDAPVHPSTLDGVFDDMIPNTSRSTFTLEV